MWKDFFSFLETARACFNENTGVVVAALRFFLGFDLHEVDSEDSDSDFDNDSSNPA